MKTKRAGYEAALTLTDRLRALIRPIETSAGIDDWGLSINAALRSKDDRELILQSLLIPGRVQVAVTETDLTLKSGRVIKIGFPAFHLALVSTVAERTPPDADSKTMKDVLIAVFRYYRQDAVFNWTVENYEAALIKGGMKPDDAWQGTRLIVSGLADDDQIGKPIDRQKPLDQAMTKGKRP